MGGEPRELQMAYTQPLLSILASLPPDVANQNVLHYLSIDAEGAETEIIRQFPFGRYNPLVITIEYHHDLYRRLVIRNTLRRLGYVLDVTEDSNDFFMLKR